MAQQDGLYHTRSISLPSRSHPLALRFEEELLKLTNWAASLPSPSLASLESLREGLLDLGKVYDSVGNLLRMPGVQKVIGARKHERWVIEELDCSVKLLDMCSVARESMSLLKEHVDSLRSSLKTRRIDDKVVVERAQGYASCRRRVGKEVRACMKMLRKMREGEASHDAFLEKEPELSLVVRALRETRKGAEAVLGCVLAKLVEAKTSTMRWRMVLRRSTTRSDEMGELDMAIERLARKSGISEDVEGLQEKLGGVGVGINGVELGLEGVFRKVIQSRVAILNISTT